MSLTFRTLLAQTALIVFFFASTNAQCDPSCATCSGTTATDCDSCYPDSYYDATAHTCTPCISPCATCTAAGNGNCLSCISTAYYVNAGTCTPCTSPCVTCSSSSICLSCLNGYYLNTVSNTCDPCDSSCATCVGTATNCLSCNADRYYNAIAYTCTLCDSPCATCTTAGNGNCQSCISNAYYVNAGTCTPCTAPCATCQGGTSNDCLSCLDNTRVYVAATHTCEPCYTGCATCSGLGPTNCLSCISNYFYTAADKTCTICHPSCATCDGPLQTDCLTCPPTTYLLTLDNSCVACTGDGFSISGSNCIKCHITCKTCVNNGATGCQSCYNPTNYFFLSNTSCVPCTEAGWFVNTNNNCTQCSSNCATCATSASNCLTCPSGNFLNQSSATCVTCTVERFFQNPPYCTPCHTNCLTCNGILNTNCLSCDPGKYILENNHSCVYCNEIGYSVVSGKCIKCDTSCASCRGVGAGQCESCYLGTNYFVSSNTSCTSCVQAGYYRNGGNCSLCDSTCQTCDTHPPKCQTCKSGYFFVSSNQTCMTCNVDDYFQDGLYCKQCSSICRRCSSASSTDCLACKTGERYFINEVPGNKTCVECTVDGYSPIGTDCVKCHSSCKHCSDTTDKGCTACYDLTYLIDSNHSCNPCDIDGVFVNGLYCEDCSSNCKSCFGSASNCTSCFDYKYLVDLNKTCVECNVDEFFINGTYCTPCNETCRLCSGPSATECQACKPNFYYFSTNHSCVDCSADGYSPMGDNCTKCHDTCRRCSDTQETNCTACYLENSSYLITSNNTCNPCTAEGYFVNGANCDLCDDNCKTCIDTAAKCTSCKDGEYLVLWNHTCVTCDVDDYYINHESDPKTCEECHDDCRRCTNNTNTSCIACHENRWLVLANSSCTVCNEDGYSPVETTCVKCDSSCKHCTDTTDENCTECYSDKYLLETNHSCVECDYDGYFREDTYCKLCDNSCRRCNDTHATNCTACYDYRYLFDNNGSCIPCLEDGYFQSSPYCKLCHNTCKTCDGTEATDCLTCYPFSSPAHEYPHYYVGNRTCLACDNVDSFFVDGIYCKDCHETCRRCNGTEATNCTECFQNGTVMDYLMPNTTCMNCTFDAFYIADPLCKPCDASCRTCNGSFATECISCWSGFYLIKGNNSCTDCQIFRYYQSPPYCEPCDPTCLSCLGPLATHCTSCDKGKYLLQGENTCGNCTREGYYIDGGHCKKCNPTCKTCNGASATSCLSCDMGSSLPYLTPYNNSCSDCNLTSFYLSEPRCLQCDASCLNCRGGDIHDCDGCASGYYANGFALTCVKNCPSPLANNNTGMNCSFGGSLATDFADYFDANFDTQLQSVPSRTENHYLLIQSLAYEYNRFVDRLLAGGTGCPSCSGHGSCRKNEDYLVDMCACSSGYKPLNCALEPDSVRALNASAINFLKYLQEATRDMRLTMDSNGTIEYLNAVLTIVNDSFVTGDMAAMGLDIARNMVYADLENRAEGDVFDPQKMQLVLRIVDACTQYVKNQDCPLNDLNSGEILNMTVNVTSGLSVLQLWGKEAGDPYVLNSTNLYLGSMRYNNTVSANFQFGDNPPVLVALTQTKPLADGETVDVHTVYYKTDQFNCPKNYNSSQPPLISIQINEKDSINNSTLSSQFGAKLYYPPVSGSKYSACLTGCNVGSETINGTSYFVCDCESLTSLNANTALVSVFANSNLGKLASASALLTFDYVGSWVFWLLMVITFWYLVSMITLRLKVIKPLSFKVPKNMVLDVSFRRFTFKEPIYKVAAKAFCYGHAFMSIYFYEDRLFPRTTRATLMYCRLLSLAAFSSIFNKAASGGGFLSTVIVMGLPYVTVMPVNLILKFLLLKKKQKTSARAPIVNNLTPKKQRKQRDAQTIKKIQTIKTWLGIIFAICVWGGCVYIILVVAANSTFEESKTWSKNFLITLNQDMFVTPLIKVCITIVVLKRIRYIKHRLLFKIAKSLADPLTTRALTILTVKPMSLDEMLKQKAMNAVVEQDEKTKKAMQGAQNGEGEAGERDPMEVSLSVDKSETQALSPKKERIIDPMLNLNTRKRRARKSGNQDALANAINESLNPSTPRKQEIKRTDEKTPETDLAPLAGHVHFSIDQERKSLEKEKIRKPPKSVHYSLSKEPNKNSDVNSDAEPILSDHNKNTPPKEERKDRRARKPRSSFSREASSNKEQSKEPRDVSKSIDKPYKAGEEQRASNGVEEQKGSSPSRKKVQKDNFRLPDIPYIQDLSSIQKPREMEQAAQLHKPERRNKPDHSNNDESQTELVGTGMQVVKLAKPRKGGKRYLI